MPFIINSLFKIFLSTLSLRRATPQGCFCYLDNIVFYPRSPCGERRIGLVFLWWGVRISIHALLAESDWCISRKQPVQAAFLSTLSLRRATVSKRRLPSSCRLFLSTLSLRRATIKWLGYSELGIHFYPRSPCGERPANRKCLDFGWCISIHALLAESDSALAPKQNPTEHFYPRSPCGERQSMQDRPEEK